MKKRARFELKGRILLSLAAVAALSTALALAVQDQALYRDLEGAALVRLQAAADATSRLVDQHLATQAERYRAISGTPQFRATLEVEDQPTLAFFARQLAAREKAALIVFLDRAGVPMAAAGELALVDRVAEVGPTGLLDDDGVPLAVVTVPLRTRGKLVGRLVAAEVIDEALVAQWSALCGAHVAFVPSDAAASGDRAERVVTRLASVELRVGLSLDAEREALVHSRFNLLAAGGVGLCLAFGVSILVSRSLVRPILQIKGATVRVGQGDFSARLRSDRGDEIGDVARAVDLMLDHLGGYRDQVERQHRALEENLQRLGRSQEQLANAQRLARIGSWQLDLDTGELWGSDEFRAILGLGLDDKPLDPREALSRVDAADRAGLESAMHACVVERATMRLDCRIVLESAQDRILHLQAEVRPGSDGEADVLEGTIQDVTDRKRSEEQIRYLAHHDSLTGLGNRLLCRERLAIQLTQARRQEQVVGLLVIDLDRFKRINDTLGHSHGDELLKVVADRLIASLRTFIGRSELATSVSRLGGDEFTVVVVDPDDVQDLATLARRILDALTRPFVLGGHEVVISASIGITTFPHDAEDVESMLRNADAAMYHAKEQGRNNYQFYAESMNEIALRRLILESKLRRALEEEQFELRYQPKISLTTGRVTGAEALIRWRDPEAGLVPPGDFIPIAEETGLIVPLGDWVVKEACEQIARWQKAGMALPVSVNLSVQQFRFGELPERIMAALGETGAAPELLELEITESTLMRDESTVVADLQALRAEGVTVALDDFGTGYSSFAYLRDLPVDKLKIDRSFVIDIATRPDDAALAAAIVSMGRALGLGVVAEGVEIEAQRDLLASWSCDEAQGFLFSAALGASEFERLFGEREADGRG